MKLFHTRLSFCRCFQPTFNFNVFVSSLAAVCSAVHLLCVFPPGVDARPTDVQSRLADHDFLPLAGIYLLSAFLDERPNDFDNEERGTLIRLMAVVTSEVTPEDVDTVGMNWNLRMTG